MTISCQRHLFDIPSDICYLNASYMTPVTLKQAEVGEAALKRCMQPWTVSPQDFFDTVQPVKDLSARMFGVNPEDMAVIPSVSYGIASAAKNIKLEAGQKIILLEHQFPSNVYEWRDLAEAQAASIITVPTPENHDWTSAILEVLAEEGEAAGLLALANVHWSSGALFDLKAISVECRKNGVSLVLDLTQSAGAVPINLAEIDPDFAVIGSYKWMMGPYSMGVMYVPPRNQQGRPLEQNWIARKDSENFSQLVDYKDGYQSGAARFDMGEKSNFILSPVYAEGIRQLLEWGVENIATSIDARNMKLAAICVAAGFEPIEAAYRSPNILGVHVGKRADEVLGKLKENNISAGIRGDMLRLAPHLWVNENDLDRFESVFKSLK